jgi:uncharacterized protein YycO
MKTTPRVFLLLALVVALSWLYAGCAVKPVINPDAALKPEETSAVIRSYLRTGDWLVARGVHAADDFVSTMTNMPFSHAAIYDAATDEVMEAEGEGVHPTSLADFLAKSSRIWVIRPMWSTVDTAPEAVKRARSLIGKGYNFTGLIGIDWPDRYYCTQLAIEAYKPFITPNGNPIPQVISPGRMHHWGRILFDTGP